MEGMENNQNNLDSTETTSQEHQGDGVLNTVWSAPAQESSEVSTDKYHESSAKNPKTKIFLFGIIALLSLAVLITVYFKFASDKIPKSESSTQGVNSAKCELDFEESSIPDITSIKQAGACLGKQEIVQENLSKYDYEKAIFNYNFFSNEKKEKDNQSFTFTYTKESSPESLARVRFGRAIERNLVWNNPTDISYQESMKKYIDSIIKEDIDREEKTLKANDYKKVSINQDVRKINDSTYLISVKTIFNYKVDNKIGHDDLYRVLTLKGGNLTITDSALSDKPFVSKYFESLSLTVKPENLEDSLYKKELRSIEEVVKNISKGSSLDLMANKSSAKLEILNFNY